MLGSRRKNKVIALVLVVVISLFVLVGCGDNGSASKEDNNNSKTVTIGYVNWAECVAVSNLWKVLLEEQGYNVKLTQLDVAPLFVGLKKGDVDLFFDSWLPVLHGNYMEKYKDSIQDNGIWYESTARLGIVVPKYVTIDSLEEFEANKDKFNNQIVGIDPGAGMMKATEQGIKDYKLSAELVQGSESAMLASLEKAYKKDKWIAITGWNPHWMFAKYDLKYLDDPLKMYGEGEYIHSVSNKDFATENEEVTEMIKKFKMDDNDIGSLELLINEGMKPEAAAKQWIEENQDKVDEWIK